MSKFQLILLKTKPTARHLANFEHAIPLIRSLVFVTIHIFSVGAAFYSRELYVEYGTLFYFGGYYNVRS